jgi:hypothetical protein
MTNPSWREIKWAKVPAKPDGLWTVILEHISGPRLLRISVKDKDKKKVDVAVKWHTTETEDCGANGIARDTSSTTGTTGTASTLIMYAPYGALVGKLGGSTADLPEGGSGGPYSGRKVFTAGTYCVVTLAANEGGPLFLTMNDIPTSFDRHSGELTVLIEEAPL